MIPAQSDARVPQSQPYLAPEVWDLDRVLVLKQKLRSWKSEDLVRVIFGLTDQVRVLSE
jgi:hypothetical protein